jgi:hypothetical protein
MKLFAALLAMVTLIGSSALPVHNQAPAARPGPGRLPVPCHDQSGCLMKLEHSGGQVQITCTGSCTPDCATGGTISHGGGWVSCQCPNSTNCAAFFNTVTGAINCLRNACPEPCTQETEPPPPGDIVIPCVCL